MLEEFLQLSDRRRVILATLVRIERKHYVSEENFTSFWHKLSVLMFGYGLPTDELDIFYKEATYKEPVKGLHAQIYETQWGQMRWCNSHKKYHKIDHACKFYKNQLQNQIRNENKEKRKNVIHA